MVTIRLASQLRSTSARALFTCALLGQAACGDDTELAAESAEATTSALSLRIGPEGGELVGEAGSAIAGVRVVIPAGAIAEPTTLTLQSVDADGEHLPATARACGPMFELLPRGLDLKLPAEITAPYDASIVEDAQRLPEDVKVWVKPEASWLRELQLEASGSSVHFQLGQLGSFAAGVNPAKSEDVAEFDLLPVAKNLPCIAQYPGDPSRAPTLKATVVRGDQNDTLYVRGENILPELGFDLFTTERSLFGIDGKPVSGFAGFGLSWYQTDLEANHWGKVRAVVRTVLLDEIFGLEQGGALGPTETFHLGVWFNDPSAAVACGFDASKPTPFNGEQQAGPLAFGTAPRAETGLGPLCVERDDTSPTPRCKK
jgi:hypothetical protein